MNFKNQLDGKEIITPISVTLSGIHNINKNRWWFLLVLNYEMRGMEDLISEIKYYKRRFKECFLCWFVVLFVLKRDCVSRPCQIFNLNFQFKTFLFFEKTSFGKKDFKEIFNNNFLRKFFSFLLNEITQRIHVHFLFFVFWRLYYIFFVLSVCHLTWRSETGTDFRDSIVTMEIFYKLS